MAALALAAALILSGALAVGCGDDSEPAAGEQRAATLILDFVPGPLHAGIYLALAEGYYEARGIDLEVIQPTSTADTLKLIDAGKADFGIADGIDVAGQIDAGRDAQGILALTQRPIGGLITLADAGIDSPADLSGTTIGVTGVPSDDVVLDAILADGGVDPDSIERVTIGFNGVQALENEKLDAFTGYIPAEGVQAEVDGFPTRSFPLDENGGPRYPGSVVFSTRDQIAADPELMDDFVAATVRGYEDAIADPDAAVAALLDANPAIPEDFATASFDAYLPLFDAGASFGEIDDADAEALSAFLTDAELIDAPIQSSRFATGRFLPEGG